MYRCTRNWKDLTNNHLYKKGDEYPIEGDNPTKKRIQNLLNGKNKSGYVLIEEVEAPTTPIVETPTTPEGEPTEVEKTDTTPESEPTEVEKTEAQKKTKKENAKKDK